MFIESRTVKPAAAVVNRSQLAHLEMSSYYTKMPDAIISEILRSGVSGAIFLLLVFAYWSKEKELAKKSEELAKSNEARISDARAIQERLLSNNSDCVSALRDVANSLQTSKDAMLELRDSFRDLGEDLRKSNRH